MNYTRVIHCGIISFIILFTFSNSSLKISPKLLKTLQLRTNHKVNILLTFKDTTVQVTNELKLLKSARKHSTRHFELNFLARNLKLLSASSQTPTIYLLTLNGIQFKSFWVSNQIYIKNATLHLIQLLSRISEIEEIKEEPIYQLINNKNNNELQITNKRKVITISPSRPSKNLPWGIKATQAEQVWPMGITGNNVIVGIIDTGVRFSHESLRQNYIGPDGWFDPSSPFSLFPYDDNGHGTHVTGTILGRNIGVAPKAKWMACKGCSTRTCQTSHLLACAQFIICPNGNCNKTPHIVNNSWGGPSKTDEGETEWDRIISTWISAGILPVFSIGNSGPRCSTHLHPGDNEDVLGVGSIGANGSVSTFSSRGPSFNGRFKPDLAAPGEFIRSAWHLSDDWYNEISGTSMAAPHVAGIAALVKSKRMNMSVEELKRMILRGCEQTNPTGQSCGGLKDEEVYPNNHVGWGKVNALKSVILT